MMHSERAEPGEHCIQRLICCGTIEHNGLLYSINTMIQNNAEGLMRKKAIHLQRKNCGSRNTEEKQMLEIMC